MEHPLVRFLRECHASGELVAVYRWGDDPSIFIVGQIVSMEEGGFTLKLVETDGSWEATPLDTLKLSRVVSIDRRTPYLSRLQAWLDEYKGEPGLGVKTKQVSNNIDKIRSIISDAFTARTPIDLKLREDEFATCLMSGLSEDWVQFLSLDDFCRPLGESFVRLDAVSAVRHGGRSRAREAWLYRRNVESSR